MRDGEPVGDLVAVKVLVGVIGMVAVRVGVAELVGVEVFVGGVVGVGEACAKTTFNSPVWDLSTVDPNAILLQ